MNRFILFVIAAGLAGCEDSLQLTAPQPETSPLVAPDPALAGITGNAPIVDALGVAIPSTPFSVFGSSGVVASSSELVGPEFILTEPTVITEIGGFLNNCVSIAAGVPQCPGALPFTVQIRPSNNGVPDASTVVASFVLSHDNDPLLISFESVAVNLALGPGSYFALFAPQGSDVGHLLQGASVPFTYQAGLITMGVLNPLVGTSSVETRVLAVRILGTRMLWVAIDIKPGDDPNSINPRSRGVIPVAILTTDALDAATIDPATVRFGPTGTEAAARRVALEDADGDGDEDMILHFNTPDTGIVCGNATASLTGQTVGGQTIKGSDSIRPVGCR